MDKEIVEHYEDIRATVVYQIDDYNVEFKAYEIVANDGKKMYERKDSKGSGDEVYELKDAQTLIRGLVKWDGCSHFFFGDEEGYIHLCGRYCIVNVSELIKKIFYRSGELMPENKDIKEFNI